MAVQKANEVLVSSSVKLSFTFTNRAARTAVSGTANLVIYNARDVVKFSGTASSIGSGTYELTFPSTTLTSPGRYRVRVTFTATTGEVLTEDFDLFVVRSTK